jgi:threonine synthase
MPLFYSTNNRLARVTLEEAVITGLAPDGGLYMPEDIPQLPRAFIDNMAAMSLHEVAYAVIYYALQGDVPSHALKDIIVRTFNFDIPLVRTRGGRFVLELFHGPTMAFKDVGARFMARLR